MTALRGRLQEGESAMMGGNADTCWTCGAAYLAGCVMGGECPDCESKRITLEGNGWKIKKSGFFGLEEALWEDPKFPGTTYKQSEALRIQEGRTIEQFKKGMEP